MNIVLKKKHQVSLQALTADLVKGFPSKSSGNAYKHKLNRIKELSKIKQEQNISNEQTSFFQNN